MSDGERTSELARTGGRQPASSTPGGREARILGIIETARAKRPRFKDPAITMAHGAGGKATQTLIEAVFLEAFSNPLLAPLEDLLLAAQLLVPLAHVLVASFTR